MSEEIKSFRIEIPEAVVERYNSKIRDTRVPTKDIVYGDGSDYGFTTQWATDLYQALTDKHNWCEVTQVELGRWCCTATFSRALNE